jgi:D-alanyl-D-alanine carboxypeptidase
MPLIMKNVIRTLLLFFLISFAPVQVWSQTTIDTEKLHNFFTVLEENQRFIGSLYVSRDGEEIFSRAYGIRTAEGDPSTPDTRYRIGSITKSYTAAMILKFIEDGDLSFETTLDQFFPGIPNADRITIEHLLRHQSGLANFTSLEDYVSYMEQPRSRDEHISRFEQLDTSFDPGAGTEYSNTGYVLLGFIIEEVSGQTYNEALQQMIVDPLGLNSTYTGSKSPSSAEEAESFIFQNGQWIPASTTDLSVTGGAGSIVATAKETSQFYRSLFEGVLLAEKTVDKMTSFEGPVGMGVIRIPFYDRYLTGHNGGIDGYRSNAAYDPQTGLSFALLGNGVNYSFNDILIGMLSIVYGREYSIPTFEERQPITMTREQLTAYTGTYASPGFPLKIQIFIENGSLKAQATGQAAFPLTMFSNESAAFEQAGIEITFNEENGGRYTGFEFQQAGATYQFTLEE